MEIESPEVIQLFDKSIGGVDKHDQANKIKKVDTQNDLSRYGLNCWIDFINNANAVKIPRNK